MTTGRHKPFLSLQTLLGPFDGHDKIVIGLDKEFDKNKI
jgi:hypothetical protein